MTGLCMLIGRNQIVQKIGVGRFFPGPKAIFRGTILSRLDWDENFHVEWRLCSLFILGHILQVPMVSTQTC